MNKVRLENGQVKRISPVQGISPFSQFLGPTAVESPRANPPWQAELGSHSSQAVHRCGQIDAPPGEKFLQGATLLGCLRMERKGNPPDRDIVLPHKPFNTPGNEIAPRSDVIGENLHEDLLLFIHEPILLLL
jgi:hypothetical protein